MCEVREHLWNLFCDYESELAGDVVRVSASHRAWADRAMTIVRDAAEYNRAVSIGRETELRSLVGECCAGAVVELLPLPTPCDAAWLALDLPPVPIANCGCESLAEEVARELAGGEVTHHEPPEDVKLTVTDTPPFAAVWWEDAGGRHYVLVSGACPECVNGEIPWDAEQGFAITKCDVCDGTGARTDVGEIARRYGGDGDARVARFEVKP